MSKFTNFALSEATLKAIGEMGFEEATPIQAQSFPLLLADEATDFLGLAQTGTGKTAAFGLPLLQRIDPKSSSVQAVILAPTRELCQQIASQLKQFSKYMRDVEVVAVFGGAPIQGQIKELRQNPQIVVGTPGRFTDFLKRKRIKLDDIKYFVLDEADEMLNMGFKEEIDEILTYASEVDHRTWLFSATMPREVRRITNQYMSDPAEVQIISEQKTNVNISHMYSEVRRDDKVAALKRIIDVHPDIYGLIFCNMRVDTVDIAKNLVKDGYAVDYLNGDLSQAQRDNVMERFKHKQINLLIATDVAARGIDVNDLTHVIHYRLPDQLENYTHRSGRTARAGKSGISLALVSGRDTQKIRRLNKQLGIDMEPYSIPLASEVAEIRVHKWVDQVASIKGQELEVSDETKAYIQEQLSGMSKLELVQLLLHRDLGKAQNRREKEDLNYTRGDRNQRYSERRRDGGRGDRRERGGRDRRERPDRRERGEGRDRQDRRDDRSADRSREGRRGRGEESRSERFDRREEPQRDRGPKREFKREAYASAEDSSYSAADQTSLKEIKTKAVRENFQLFTLDVGVDVISNKGHLLRLVCDKTGLSKRHFGDMRLDNDSAVISVKHAAAHQFAFSFNGTKVQGQKITINKLKAGKGRKRP